MPTYLLSVSIGPVQSLIDAARRTRDLWGGSWLLSEVSRAAALRLHQAQPGSLIFPSPADPERALQPQDQLGDQANIANILRACVDLPDAEAVRALSAEAAAAARARLRQIGERVRSNLSIGLRDALWDAQLADLLDIQAVWVQLPAEPERGGRSAYATASQTLGGLLAARKSTRTFAQTPRSVPAGLPKSSLDGAAESVLPPAAQLPPGARHALGLSSGEQLDALGVLKRLAGRVDQFSAWSRIAVDPWVEDLAQSAPAALARLREAYEPLVGLGLATRVSGNSGRYADFPYDAQLLFGFRISAALANEVDGTAMASPREALLTLQHALAAAVRARGSAPVPYAAILKADGDRMGKLLQRARTADDSRAISERLHGFASSVAALVREHRGHAIYAGGDDVLALIPRPQALACAAALAKAFAQAMAPIAQALALPADEYPTLSVGLGIGHIMEPLGRLRERAASAERNAKQHKDQPERNALAILLGIRSGSELGWRAQWSDEAAFAALHDFVAAYTAGELPSRVAYDLRAISLRSRALARLNSASGEGQTPTDRAMAVAEVRRTLSRAHREGGRERISAAMRERVLAEVERQPLDALADTLILARWLAARSATELGESRP